MPAVAVMLLKLVVWLKLTVVVPGTTVGELTELTNPIEAYPLASGLISREYPKFRPRLLVGTPAPVESDCCSE